MNERQRQYSLQAASLIEGAFVFAETREGFQFWDYVTTRLEEIAADGAFERVRRIPTDEDAKKRPMARFRDRPEAGWHEDVLLAVLPEGEYRFVSGSPDAWRFCELIEEPGE